MHTNSFTNLNNLSRHYKSKNNIITSPKITLNIIYKGSKLGVQKFKIIYFVSKKVLIRQIFSWRVLVWKIMVPHRVSTRIASKNIYTWSGAKENIMHRKQRYTELHGHRAKQFEKCINSKNMHDHIFIWLHSKGTRIPNPIKILKEYPYPYQYTYTSKSMPEYWILNIHIQSIKSSLIKIIF